MSLGTVVLIIFGWVIVGFVVTTCVAVADLGKEPGDRMLETDQYLPRQVYVLFSIALGPLIAAVASVILVGTVISTLVDAAARRLKR